MISRCSSSMHGSLVTQTHPENGTHIGSVSRNRTLGASTTCTGTLGNGVATSTQINCPVDTTLRSVKGRNHPITWSEAVDSGTRPVIAEVRPGANATLGLGMCGKDFALRLFRLGEGCHHRDDAANSLVVRHTAARHGRVCSPFPRGGSDPRERDIGEGLR